MRGGGRARWGGVVLVHLAGAGRDIGVSATFFENLARTLKLDAKERRHLFLLAHQRLPPEPGKTWCVVPPLVHRLMANLPLRPEYVLNLRWDVLAWNAAADRLFGFSRSGRAPQPALATVCRPSMRTLFNPWQDQALQILSSFRRDFVRAPLDPDIGNLVKDLEKVDTDFRTWWRQQDIHGPCKGVRYLSIPEVGPVVFDHTSLKIDVDRDLRLVYYAAREGQAQGRRFEQWLIVKDGPQILKDESVSP